MNHNILVTADDSNFSVHTPYSPVRLSRACPGDYCEQYVGLVLDLNRLNAVICGAEFFHTLCEHTMALVKGMGTSMYIYWGEGLILSSEIMKMQTYYLKE